jgi:drug/metabolite transporter (DMT)-like permease
MNRGILYLILAEVCFSSATVFAKLVGQLSSIPTVEITFTRFFFGVIVGFAYLKKSGGSFRPNRLSLLIWRGVLNCAAVFLFFLAVRYTTVTNANMLNMSYPAFIFLIAPFINREKSSPFHLIFLIATIAGIYLVVNPNFDTFNTGDIIALISGFAAALAVCTLREARKYDGTFTILFYMMGTGAVINGIALVPQFVLPKADAACFFLVISGLVGVLGQVFITSGYKHVTAKSGSLVSSARIVFAAVMGISIFGDPLSLRIAAGGALILLSISCVSLFQNKASGKGNNGENVSDG